MSCRAPAVHQIKPRILVVDDHELVREGIASLLEERWEVCGVAGNGMEAIEKVRELKPDLVLLDLSMPIMSGTRAAKAIRTLEPATKIVFMSMHDSPTVAELVRIAGADGFVSKHCHAENFLQAIAALFRVS
jgi:two-component system, NarL family, nitrate/nitrite response regulator NarL